MRHEVSYVFADEYKTIQKVINRMHNIGYEYYYKELKMADGTVHTFLVCCDEWTEIPDMEATLKWVCSDIYRLKDAYDNGIVRVEVSP